MGKMSDLDLQIRELRSCGETIIEIANTLAGMFYSQAAEDAPPEEKPKSLTLEEVRHRMTGIAQAGYLTFAKASSSTTVRVQLYRIGNKMIPTDKLACISTQSGTNDINVLA